MAGAEAAGAELGPEPEAPPPGGQRHPRLEEEKEGACESPGERQACAERMSSSTRSRERSFEIVVEDPPSPSSARSGPSSPSRRWRLPSFGSARSPSSASQSSRHGGSSPVNVPVQRSQRRVSCPNAAEGQQHHRSHCRLDAIREAFDQCDVSGTGSVSVADLARWWASAADSKSTQPLTMEERSLIAADVQRFFEQADIYRAGKVSIHQWLHFALLEAQSPGPAALAAIASALEELDDENSIRGIVNMWLQADEAGLGIIRLGCLVASMLSRNHSFEAEELIRCLGADMGRRVTYAEFCAWQAGLEHQPVELLYYDVSKSLAKYLAPLLLGHTEEGVWHTSIVVFGREFFYLGGIQTGPPGETPFGKPTKSLRLGSTLRTKAALIGHIRQLGARFQRETYDIFTNNCNHCCDSLAVFLLGRHIPNQVRLLSDRLMGTPLARLLRPLLNRCFSGQEDARNADQRATRQDAKQSPGPGAAAAEPPAGAAGVVGGGVVLYDHPGSLMPVTARVVGAGDDDTSDLCWLDKAGRRRVSRGVKNSELRPYQALAGEAGEVKDATLLEQEKAAWAKEVYTQALDAISESDKMSSRQSSSVELGQQARPQSLEIESCEEVAQQPPSAQQPAEAAGLASAVSTPCSGGHLWRRKPTRSLRPSCLRTRRCSQCQASIPRKDLWMGCARCKRIICEECWEARMDATDGSPNCRSRGNAMAAAGESSSPRRRCQRGHLLERLAGQALRNAATCRHCGTKELGATFPFFLSCRLCGYDLCPLCVEVPSAGRPCIASL